MLVLALYEVSPGVCPCTVRHAIDPRPDRPDGASKAPVGVFSCFFLMQAKGEQITPVSEMPGGEKRLSAVAVSSGSSRDNS